MAPMSKYTVVVRQIAEHVHTIEAEHYQEALQVAESIRQDYIANDLNYGSFDVVQVGTINTTPAAL